MEFGADVEETIWGMAGALEHGVAAVLAVLAVLYSELCWAVSCAKAQTELRLDGLGIRKIAEIPPEIKVAR